MRWYHRVAHFCGGMFLMNAVPHLTKGMTGTPFQSPFATPPGVGLSSPESNVVWALINLAFAYALLVLPGRLDPRNPLDVAAPAAGLALSGLLVARYFGGLHG